MEWTDVEESDTINVNFNVIELYAQQACSWMHVNKMKIIVIIMFKYKSELILISLPPHP